MICNCCYEDKPWREFSNSAKPVSAKCIECNMWIRLLRPYFGPTRDWEDNRKKTAERRRLKRLATPKVPKVKQPKPPRIKERANYVYAYRTILADAPWPYRSASGVCGVSVPEDNRNLV